MKSKLIVAIPVRNGVTTIVRTLDSIANQTMQPDRVVVQNNNSTDKTKEIVMAYKRLKIEWVENGADTLSIGNFNRALDELSEQTEYLHLCCADDMIQPRFYERLIKELEDCPGYGMAYSLDERVDDNDQHLNYSAKSTGTVDVIPLDDYLRAKAEIANQAVSGTLFKTAYQKPAARLRNFIVMWDTEFHAEWATHCKKIVRVNEYLSQFRWHGANGTLDWTATIEPIVIDEWRVMQVVEKMRKQKPGFIRGFKLRGIFAVRSGIKAMRYRQDGNPDFARKIVEGSKAITGSLAWYMAQVVVQAREIWVYKICGRRRHPKNFYA
jgi:glycosyltransferase involved in cell wall biosynthesis